MKKAERLWTVLKRAIKSIHTAAAIGNNNTNERPVCKQAAANLYYYNRKWNSLKRDIHKLEALDGQNGMPYIFGKVWDGLKKNGGEFDRDLLAESLKGYNCKSDELDMLGAVINAAAFVETGLVCAAELSGQAVSVRRLQNAFLVMKKAELTDFTPIYRIVSETEKTFYKAEEGFADMTEGTKAAYRKALRRFATRHNTDELSALNYAVKEAKKLGVCVGKVLLVDKQLCKWLYLGVFGGIFALTLTFALLLCPLWAVILLAPPITAFSLGVTDFCFAIRARVQPCPAIAPEKLPSSPLTLTVITVLLDSDCKAAEELERFYITNSKEGMLFGILADLPSADKAETDGDKPLADKAKRRIEELNTRYGNRFCLFIRKRTQSTEGKWCGRERKRGAIEDLVRYISKGTDCFSTVVGADVRGVRFLLTLDADTKLPPDSVATLTGMLLHPLNRPQTENGRIVSGYGILQPAVQTALDSSRVSGFSSLISGAGGIDVYESAAFNRQQSVFGAGIFCGKGLIDIAAYSAVLDGVLPKGRVLSHDMPEGNILRTRYVSQLSFTDDVPSNPLAYYSRMHRWIRGDTQNLSLLFGYRQGVLGAWRIVLGVLRHLCPVLSFASLAIAGFTACKGGLWVCLFALLGLLSPVAFTLISQPAALRFKAVRFFSSVQSGTVQSLKTTFYELSALCHKSLVTLDAVFRALFRLATGKGLLSWVTAAQAEKNTDGAVASYIYRMFPSALIGAVFFFGTGLWVTRLLGLLWFLFPIYCNYLSLPAPERKKPSAATVKELKERALPIWQFFADNVNQSTAHLPPDNIQLSPVEAVAMRTSPTNIGLYLLSTVAAMDFGFITPTQAEDRIEATLGTVEQLKKWNGHLYNWYALDSTEVLGGGYVSTVDSGNLCVCLVALARYLYSAGRDDLARRAEVLYEGADFGALYNSERELFALGYDSGADKVSDICYDLYMSEARSTSYFAIAFGQVGVKHWKRLGRHLVSSGGHIGMASWSGTAFEYFMPHLLLPVYKNSFAYESLRFALNRQRRFCHGKLWGCSESAYFCFDGDMNYQYKAHGVQSLALARYSGDEMVLSPYSVYLSLCVSDRGVTRTLSAYDKELYGKYGLYEAIDCTENAPIQSYMAHHMGMSLIACANACFDDVFVKRFMNHPRTAAFYELLQEKIPVNACVTDANKSFAERKPPSAVRSFAERLTDTNRTEPFYTITGNGKNTITADSTGHIRLCTGDITVNETHFVRDNAARSLNVLFFDGKDVFSAAPYKEDGGKYSFECAAAYTAHIHSSAQFSGRVKYYCNAAGCFVVETKSKADQRLGVLFAYDVQLATDRQFYAHPAFNRLFVSAAFDKENNTLIYTKNTRGGKDCIYMAVGLGDKEQSFEFETNKDVFPTFSLYSPFDLVRDSYSCKTGVCVTPFCLIKTPLIKGGEARLIIAVGHSKEECVARLNASRRHCAPVGKALFGERENPLLDGVLCGRSENAATALAKEGALWGRGISGDHPIVAVLVRELYEADILFFLQFFKRLAELNVRIELVFLTCEEDKYSSACTYGIKRLITKEKLSRFVCARGGIFFADGTEQETVLLFKEAAVYFAESYDSPFINKNAPAALPDKAEIVREATGVPLITAPAGYYLVDKSTPPRLPQSYVLAGRRFGAVVTHSSLGYSFYDNASLRKIAAFEGDIYGGTDIGEAIYARKNGKLFDLAACAVEVLYGNGVAIYRGEIEGNPYTLTVFVCEKLPLKAIKVRFEKGEEETVFAVLPLMDSGAFPADILTAFALSTKDCAALGFTAPKSSFFSGYVGFIACVGGGEPCPHPLLKKGFALHRTGTEAVFLIGAAKTEKGAELVIERFAERGADAEEAKARGFADSMLPPVKLSAVPAYLAEMLCHAAPYQAAACRFFARAGFYQSGGAYGFRDQLQDCLYLVYSMPGQVRTHILRSACRQYTDGSVQHWWHACQKDGKTYGIRSTCSDDFLWLPICVTEYLRITGDYSVLDVQLAYLFSPPLLREKERYEAAEPTLEKESLYRHCVRALMHGKNYGRHGLCLMGSCDWNDAFSDLGEGAESVFSTLLYVIALEKFKDLALQQGDSETALFCKTEAATLKERCNAAYDGDRFVRAYSADGKALGVAGRAACEIDALCQAFAVFAGADKAKCKTAMKTAFDALYDKENKLLKLFTAPFGADTEYAGYINAYAKGVRENGGQYTHAAVWFAAALALCGMITEANELITAINPLWRYSDKKLSERYKAEPYAIAADIYTARGQAGRGGWTFYTGAAAWYCKTVLECFMGLRFEEGCSLLYLTPCIEYDASVGIGGNLHISAKKGACLTLDGKPATLPLRLDGGEHYITVDVK